MDDIHALQAARVELIAALASLDQMARTLGEVVVEDQVAMARLHYVVDSLEIWERGDAFSGADPLITEAANVKTPDPATAAAV